MILVLIDLLVTAVMVRELQSYPHDTAYNSYLLEQLFRSTLLLFGVLLSQYFDDFIIMSLLQGAGNYRSKWFAVIGVSLTILCMVSLYLWTTIVLLASLQFENNGISLLGLNWSLFLPHDLE